MQKSYQRLIKDVTLVTKEPHRMDDLLKKGEKEQEKVEFDQLLSNLALLDAWCEKNKTDEHIRFSAFFQDSIIGAYYRYMSKKQKAWSWVRNAANVVLTILLPAISTVGIQGLTEKVLPLISADGAVSGDENTMMPKLLIGGMIGLGWMAAYLYREMSNNRQYKETWVRHSVCYSRLYVALSAFAVSKQTEQDYERLVKDTFGILNQNLDQFALNMSSHGMASRD